MTHPPSLDAPLSETEFARLLQHGVGRAVLYLQQHDAAPYRDAILHACLHDERQFVLEEQRARYMYDVVQATGDPGSFAAEIREYLERQADKDSPEHIFELAALFARDGDEAVRRAMYTAFARIVRQQDYTGAEALVALDGVTGFLFVLAQFREHPLPEDSPWVEGRLLSELGEQIGVPEATAALEAAAATDANVASDFARARTAYARWREGHRRPAEAMPTYEQIQTVIHTTSTRTAQTLCRRWGRRLGEDDLGRFAKELQTETGRAPLLNYLSLFKQRRFPLSPRRLVGLARGGDADIAAAAREVLSRVKHPLVRALALELAGAGKPWEVVDLLVPNYHPGDESLLAQLVEYPADDEEYHWLVLSVRQLLKRHLTPAAEPVLLTLYQKNPCSVCRKGIVEHLLTLGLLPGWMREECRYDADLETRELAAS